MPTNTKPVNQRFIIKLSFFCFILFAIFAIILAFINAQKTATVDIIIAPSTATITVDQHSFKTKETARYFPGNYLVKISAPGFVEQTLEVELSNQQTTHIYIALEPTDQNANYYDIHPEEASIRQAVQDATYQDNLAAFLTEHPIANILPYEHYTQNEFSEPTGYRIDYGKFDGCKSDFCLKVTSYSQTGLADAKEYIRSKGFNPNDYEILFEYDPLEKSTPDDFPPAIREILEKAGYFD